MKKKGNKIIIVLMLKKSTMWFENKDLFWYVLVYIIGKYIMY